MRWNEIGSVTCSVARTLSVIGDRWTLMILRDAFLGVRRFEDFCSASGVTRHVLADRLRKLERHKIIRRVKYQEHPPRQEYRLTEKGIDLYPIVVSMTRWGDKYMVDKKGVPMELVHKGCGHVMMPEMVCPECDERVSARDIQPRPGPALKAARK